MTIANPQQQVITSPNTKELTHPNTKELTHPPKPKPEVKNAQKPLSRLLNRVILLSAGVGLLAWGISLMANRVTSVAATKAFINGKIITVTSPLSGQIRAKADLNSGTPVTSKQLLLKVDEPLAASEWLQSLKLDLVADKAKLESIEAKIREIKQSSGLTPPNGNQQRQNNREQSINRAQEVALAQFASESEQSSRNTAVRLAEQTVKQAEIDLKIAQEHAATAYSKYKKFRFLGNQGAISSLSVEEVLNNWKVSREQIEAAKNRLETARFQLAEQQRLKSRAPQVTRNTFSLKTNAQDDNPQIADLLERKTELQVSIDAKEKAIAQVATSSQGQKDYPVLASSKGVLWEVMVQDGERVNSGQPLLKQLNCQQLWVDAFINIDDLKRVQIGSPAQVELYANNLKLNGRVKTIRSSLSGEPKLGQDVAVNPPDTKNQQLAQVRIELDHPQELIDSNESSAQFCQVGQIAKVNIGQENTLLANLSLW
ncbi:MAG TPA: HlyD family efflux transporter periplasmic adaptor subunit [Allocoleopsis sp.]